MTPITLHGPPLPSDWSTRTFAQLLARCPDGTPLLVGAHHTGDLTISRAQIAHAAFHMEHWRARHALSPGARVLLLTLPGASEVHTAAALLALLAAGLRVIAPLFDSPQLLDAALRLATPDAILADLDATDSATAATLASTAQQAAIPLLSLTDALDLSEPAGAWALDTARDPLSDALWLSTSGTSGAPRLLRHHERALLNSLASQHAARLLDPERGFGHTLIPLLAHTMGLRAVMGALWMGKKALFIPPDWLESRPWDVIRLCEQHPPTHITAGPALLHTLVRYAAASPRVAERVLPHLRHLISSGAPFDAALQADLPHIPIADALGTSETQQLTHTLANPTSGTDTNTILPGAALRLTPAHDGLYRLHARSAYAASGYAGQPELPEWIDTGDLVALRAGAVVCVGRADDIDSSGVGLRLNLGSLERDALAWLRGRADHLVLCQHPATDGLLALVFSPDLAPEELRERLAAWHDQRAARESWSELWRSRIVAAAVLPGAPPLRGPGKLDRRAVRATHVVLLDALADPFGRDPRVVRVPLLPPDAPAAQRNHQPGQAQLMAALNLDWEAVGGQGDRVTLRRAGQTREVIDLVGGFGSNLLGHANPALRAAAHAALDQLPLLDQGTARPHAARLATRLSETVGRHTGRRYIVALTSTGAEAVECAIKHAAMILDQRHTQRHDALRQRFGADHPALVREVIAHNMATIDAAKPLLISLRGGYHGKTLGALHAMGDPEQLDPLRALLGMPTLRLPTSADDAALDALRAACAAHTLALRSIDPDTLHIIPLPTPNLLAIIAEPLLGEGGVQEVDAAWLARVREVSGAPLILDEIQSGMGRTGAFLAGEGLRAEVVLLGKTLGGGLVKIGAALIDHAHYLPAFDALRGSTFGADAMSCAVASAVLDQIAREDVPALARALGGRLAAMFARLMAAHPEVLCATGRGAMWGVHLAITPGKSTLLDALAARGLGYLASAYLLEVHGLRMLPTLSAPDTLRIEPSVWLDDAAIAQLERGLGELACALEEANLFELVAHLVAPADALAPLRTMARMYAQQDPATRPFQIVREPAPPGARRVAFVHNPVAPTKLLLADCPPLALLTASQRLDLIARFERLMQLGPMPSFTRSFFDGQVWMVGITLAATPQTLEWLKRTGDLALVRLQLQRALDMAAAQGCEVVVFGAHTSIVTDAATTLHPPPGVQISSGNSFTTAVMLDRVERAARDKGVALTDATIGIVGATGSIGAALAELLVAVPSHRPLHLIGRAGAQPRLDALTQRLIPLARRPILTACDLDVLAQCDVILCATSTPEPIVHPHHLALDRPLILADVSQPAAIHPACAALPQVTHLTTGYVRLPRDPDFVMSAHTGPGQSFACAAEAILLGLSPHPHLTLHGPLDGATIACLKALGKKHGLLEP